MVTNHLESGLTGCGDHNCCVVSAPLCWVPQDHTWRSTQFREFHSLLVSVPGHVSGDRAVLWLKFKYLKRVKKIRQISGELND